MSMDADSEEYHVLAVDDSIIDRKLIERLLKTSSYQVTTVDSGSKALEFLGLREEEEEEDQSGSSSSSSDSPSVSPINNHHQEVEVNLIITDYCMPGMTGYDLLKKIKESTNLRDIPVVIMSSENVPSRISRCLEEGAEEFLLKPVRLADVKKLKPHMMKTKQLKQQQLLLLQQQQDCIKKEQEEESELRMPDTLLLQSQPQPNSSSSKRKANKEEGLSPDSSSRRRR